MLDILQTFHVMCAIHQRGTTCDTTLVSASLMSSLRLLRGFQAKPGLLLFIEDNVLFILVFIWVPGVLA